MKDSHTPVESTMPPTPHVPMTPEEVPQQRIHVVADLPRRPASFLGRCEYVEAMPDAERPKGSPRKVTYLGSVEWAWDPMHTRIDAYYLHRRRSYWLLWDRSQDENSWDHAWRWTLYGYARAHRANASEAAVYLLMDAWRHEATEGSLDHFHWINDDGFLSVGEITAIAGEVWPEAQV